MIMNNILIKYDERDNIIYQRTIDNTEYWFEYDKNSNLIHYTISTGYECWNKYNSNNNLIQKTEKFIWD